MCRGLSVEKDRRTEVHGLESTGTTNSTTFTDVLKENTKITWIEVVKKGRMKKDKKAEKSVVSRGHSLETIQ